MHYPGIKLNWLDVSRHCPCYRHSSVETAYLLIASSRQPLQYLWPHLVRTGSRKGRWQIRQWKSSSTDEINSYSYPEGKGSRGTISPSAIVLQVELQVPFLKQEREPWERGIDRPHLPHPNTAAKRLRMRQVEHFRSLFQSHFPVRSKSPARFRLHFVCSLRFSCSALCCSCFWLCCSYWNCFYG